METKKDWVVDEIVKPDDFNRIETNIEELDNRVNEIETPDFKEGDKTGTSFEPLHAKEKFPFLLEKISSWYYAIKIKSKELVDKITEIEKQHETNVNEINTDIANLENRKADKTQIPTSLPANGGNADTLGGKVESNLSVNYANSAGNADTVDNLHAANLVQNKQRSISAEELNNPNYPNSYFAETENGAPLGLRSNWYHILYFSHVNKDGFGAQIAIPLHYDKEIYYRNSEGINWSDWKRFITSDNIAAQSVNHASSCDNAAKLEGRTAAQILLQGGKHLAGQGPASGYSFLGDGAEDTGLFSDADGDLYLMKNGRRIDLPWDGIIPNTAGTIARANVAALAESVAWGNVQGKPSSYPPSSHSHDERYYTEAEMNNFLNGKANSSHTHNPNQITTGEFGGYISALRDNNYSNARIRNIYAGTGEMTPSVTPLSDGDIYICFE